MAVRWSELAWTLELTPTQMLVAQAVADYANKETGLAWMSQKTLAWKTGLSVRTIHKALKDLVKLEVLVVERPARQHYTACYRFSSETPTPRKPLLDRKEFPISDRKDSPSDRKSNASRPEGASTKPSRTVIEPSSTDWEEARRIVKVRAAGGQEFTNRAAYEATVAYNLAEERRQREQAEQSVALIAGCARCDKRGFYYEATPGSAADTGFRCAHK